MKAPIQQTIKGSKDFDDKPSDTTIILFSIGYLLLVVSKEVYHWFFTCQWIVKKLT